jgi:hypothetical protein
VSIALLEFAFERYLAIYDDPADTIDTIQYDLRHAMRKLGGPLQ